MGDLMKEFKTIDEQVEILRSRGLIIKNEDKLKRYLLNYNYYRLSGYSLKYRNKDTFKSYVYDEHLYQAFECDEEMRLALFDLCFRVEMKLKTSIAYVLGESGALSYLDDSNYNSLNTFDSVLGCYEKDKILNQAFEYVKKNNAMIYDHHRTKYNGKYPIWVIIHFLSFGDTIKYFELLKDIDKNKIIIDFSKNIFSINDFDQCMIAINCLRNACAHGDRLINKGLSRQIPKYCFDYKCFTHLKNVSGLYQKNSTNVYGYIIALVELLTDEKDVLNEFYNKLVLIFEKYYLIKTDDYGLVGEWGKNIKMDINNFNRIKNIKHKYEDN